MLCIWQPFLTLRACTLRRWVTSCWPLALRVHYCVTDQLARHWPCLLQYQRPTYHQANQHNAGSSPNTSSSASRFEFRLSGQRAIVAASRLGQVWELRTAQIYVGSPPSLTSRWKEPARLSHQAMEIAMILIGRPPVTDSITKLLLLWTRVLR